MCGGKKRLTSGRVNFNQKMLEEIIAKSKNISLDDEEIAFLKRNFEIHLDCIGQINERRRPLDIFADGFVKQCGICGAFRNYCYC